MSAIDVQALLLAAVVAVACALPGVFLVLRRLALMSDAISHAVLFGIALAYLVVRDLQSPVLILGAALTGLATVALVELLGRTGRVREDAAIGLVFPVLFSVGVIVVSRLPTSLHLDADAVLVRELEYAVLSPLTLGGVRLGPRSLYVMGTILLVNIVFIWGFYKELKLATFDAPLAMALGFAPGALHYGLMALVSVTAVGAFNAVGSALVVALMIGPPATAYLLTDRLSRLLRVSAGVGVLCAATGYALARWLDANTGGAMATMAGVLFGLAFLFAPRRGVAALALRRLQQRRAFAELLLLVHLRNHEGRPEAADENHIDRVHEHLRWDRGQTATVVRRVVRRGWARDVGGLLIPTDEGRQRAAEVSGMPWVTKSPPKGGITNENDHPGLGS